MSKNLIIVVVVAVSAAVWYFFFKGNSATDVAKAEQAARSTKPPYAPGNVAKTVVQNWLPAKGWAQPDGTAAWCMIDTLFDGGHPDRQPDTNVSKQTNLRLANAWYNANERLVYGWFKGFDLNPQKFDCGGWSYIKDELKAYMASSSAKDFDTIALGSFNSLN